ncbi:MaoC/PaaZ C-terminal domain-containing protein [Actinopolymorpha rutila]|uniref:Acyl dehydratase n=1 Tax=Actinopolymorpha rutila TaxID=446787 RepID=A0A852ZJY8_9ACTN|nr:acyl dehydratase [Actinopolymorpha rutila]
MQTVSRYFEDHRVGEDRRTTGRTITEADIVLHAGQTGDWFPHHVDAEWCATQPFGQRIAHGTLILSVAVGMTAGDINPVAFSYGYDRIRFVRPVHIGDTISVHAEIAELRPHAKRSDVGYVDEKVTVTNQRGEVVLALVHVYLVERHTPAAES